jgi:HlyD family secretion protein
VSRRTTAIAVAAIALVAIGALLGVRRGGDRMAVDVGRVARQEKFKSTVTASGEIVASRYADIGASAMGKIVSLPVAEGDRVKAGQLLARIDPVQAESEATSAAEQVRALESEERAAAEQVRAASADIAAAEAHARDADQQLSRARQLATEQLVPATELESTRAAAEAAAAQLSAARAAADQARQTLAAATRRVAQGRAMHTRARDIVSKTSIVSPMDGVVTRLRVREGEMVVVGIQNQPGTVLMTISDLGAIDAEVKVAEADVLTVKVGQPVTVTLEAIPGKRFDGTVVEVGASALPVSGTAAAAREFKVVVRLAQPDPGLRPGLTCDVEIVTSERTNVLTVPLQSVVLRAANGAEKSGVFTASDGVARFAPVTTGVIGGLDIEVDGIAEGTPIVVGPYQVLRELADGTPVRVSDQQR